jgi:pimeloyl-ACP methyl ester carboxylesterase
LYRDEALKQSIHNKACLEIGSRNRRNDFVSAWGISGEWDGERTHTDYQFMQWDDLVRQYWQRSSVLLWAKGMCPYLKLFFGGYWVRIRSISRPAATSGVFPLALLLVLLLLSLAVGVCVGFAAAFLGVGFWGALLVGAISAGITLQGASSFPEKVGSHWVLRTILFVHDWALGKHAQVDRRIEQFVDHIIAEQNQNPVDEVLLVGHSIGTMVAVDVAARLSAKKSDHQSGVQLLTLGHCIPMLSLMGEATKFRDTLKVLSQAESIPWTDVTIPPDPLCFYGLDPVRLTFGKDTYCRGPRLAVARVFRMFRAETYAKLRWNKLRLHFQYLMASELSADYDFFLTTAGPSFLSDSFERCELANSNG